VKLSQRKETIRHRYFRERNILRRGLVKALASNIFPRDMFPRLPLLTIDLREKIRHSVYVSAETFGECRRSIRLFSTRGREGRAGMLRQPFGDDRRALAELKGHE